MKLQIISDLHVDYPGSAGLPPLAAGVDMIVVAGDTCQGLVRAVEHLRRAYPPPTEIVMVAGNHELWSKRVCFEEHFEEGHLAAEMYGVRLLENSVEIVTGIHQRSILTAAYASEMLPMIDRFQPDLVVSGHTHHSIDIKRGKTRLVSNPAGYAGENRSFNLAFVVELSDP